MTDKDRRVSERVNAEVEINYIHNKDYVVSFSTDISADGMFIHSKTPPPKGEIIKLTFSIGELNQATVSAEVVWVNKSKKSKDPGMGVRFIDPPSGLREAIMKLVKRVAILEKP